MARQRTSADFLCTFQNSTFSNTARTCRLRTTIWPSSTYAMGRTWNRRGEAIIFLAPSKIECFQSRADPPYMHNGICVVNLWNGEMLTRKRSGTDFLRAFQNLCFSQAVRTWRVCTTNWPPSTYEMGTTWGRSGEAAIFKEPFEKRFFQRLCGPAAYTQLNGRCEIMEWGGLGAATNEL